MVTRTTILTVALVVASFSLALAVGPAAATDAPADSRLTDTHTVVDQCAADPPSDFEDPDRGTTEVVGWVEGYWYDEPLNISVEDGLNESELGQLSARTAARFEALRCLTVQDGLPPVDIVPREEFADDQQSQTVANTTRLVDNAKFETTLTIDSQTDSVDVRQSDSAARIGGYYDFVAEEIVIVSDDPEALRIDESVLAEELGHAIQDQHFDIGSYDRSTVDRDKGILGLIEGDVGFVVDQYLEACEAGEWTEPCLNDQASGGGGGAGVANWGLYFEQIQPYSDGPSFIQETKAEGGWEAVNDLYDDPPTTALHTVYPDTYGGVEPRNVTVPDRSTDAWDRIVLGTAPTTGGSLTADTLGISTITGMFAAPEFEDETDRSILSRESTVNFDDAGFVDQFNPHNYDHPVTEGWRGDALYTYTRNNSETATLWELAWATPEDTQQFVERYEQLVDIRGGERVDGLAHTYRFDDETGYDIALTLVPDGDRVTVVTAPSVEALTAVDQDLELLPEGYDSGDDTTDGAGDGDSADGTDDPAGGDDSGTDDPAGGDDSGTDDPAGGDDSGTDTGSDSAFGVLLVTTVGIAFVLVLGLLSAGQRRGQ
jgi:hypothetical protein